MNVGDVVKPMHPDTSFPSGLVGGADPLWSFDTDSWVFDSELFNFLPENEPGGLDILEPSLSDPYFAPVQISASSGGSQGSADPPTSAMQIEFPSDFNSGGDPCDLEIGNLEVPSSQLVQAYPEQQVRTSFDSSANSPIPLHALSQTFGRREVLSTPSILVNWNNQAARTSTPLRNDGPLAAAFVTSRDLDDLERLSLCQGDGEEGEEEEEEVQYNVGRSSPVLWCRNGFLSSNSSSCSDGWASLSTSASGGSREALSPCSDSGERDRVDVDGMQDKHESSKAAGQLSRMPGMYRQGSTQGQHSGKAAGSLIPKGIKAPAAPMPRPQQSPAAPAGLTVDARTAISGVHHTAAQSTTTASTVGPKRGKHHHEAEKQQQQQQEVAAESGLARQGRPENLAARLAALVEGPAGRSAPLPPASQSSFASPVPADWDTNHIPYRAASLASISHSSGDDAPLFEAAPISALPFGAEEVDWTVGTEIVPSPAACSAPPTAATDSPQDGRRRRRRKPRVASDGTVAPSKKKSLHLASEVEDERAKKMMTVVASWARVQSTTLSSFPPVSFLGPGDANPFLPPPPRILRFPGELVPVDTGGRVAGGAAAAAAAGGVSEDVCQMLLNLAEAVATGEAARASLLHSHLLRLSDQQGPAPLRISHYFLKALAARQDGSAAQQFTMLPTQPLEALRDAKLAYFSATPFVHFKYAASCSAVIRAIGHCPIVHIVDLGVMMGGQWEAVMKHLATRPEGPPKLLRITAVDTCEYVHSGREDLRNAGFGHLLGAELEAAAARLSLPFQFTLLRMGPPPVVSLPALQRRVEEGEGLAVCSSLELEHFADGSVISCNPRDTMLRWVQDLHPDLLVMFETEVDTNTPFFLSRFASTLSFYSSIFDLHDQVIMPAIDRKQKSSPSFDSSSSSPSSHASHSSPHAIPLGYMGTCEAANAILRASSHSSAHSSPSSPLTSPAFLFEDYHFGRMIVNSVGCEGIQRSVRAETSDSWHARMTRLGFHSLPAPGLLLDVVYAKLQKFKAPGLDLRVSPGSGAMQLLWKGKPLLFCSLWTA